MKASARARIDGVGPPFAERAAPVRLLTMTTLFPNSREPRHGIFVANRLRRIRDTGRVATTVVAPVPSFPGYYRKVAGVPLRESLDGFDVRHPRYVNVPAVGMRLQPASVARAVLGEIARSGWDANRFDVVDAHYFYPDGVAAARVAEALRRPLVISARGSDINLIGDIPFARRAIVAAAGRADAIVAVSNALAGRMVALGMPADRIHVLRNGVDASVFAPCARAEARRRIGLDERGAWVLAVGNLVPEKGLDVLIDAIGCMDPTRLLVVGEGRLERSLRVQADRVARGRVEFRANMPQAQLRFAYAAANVLALPSLREGWPNVLLEALACDTPVVAAPVGGVPEILAAGAAGTIVSERDGRAWAAALRATIDAPPAAGTMRDYALAFGWDDIVDRQCSLYERVALHRAKAAA